MDKHSAEAGMGSETEGPEAASRPQAKRKPGRPPRKQQASQPQPVKPQIEALDGIFGLRLTSPLLERVTELLPQKPTWTKSEWARHFIEVHQHLEKASAPILELLETYALNTHMTVPAQRRKPNDWEWAIDALVQLASERLAQMQRSGDANLKPLPGKTSGRTP